MENHTESGSLVEQHLEIKKKAKILRIVGPLSILLIVLWSVYSIVKMVQAFDTEVFASHIEEQGRAVWPRINERLLAIGANLQPELEEAIATKFTSMNKDLEKSLKDEFLGSGEGDEHVDSVFETEAQAHFLASRDAKEDQERKVRYEIIRANIKELKDAPPDDPRVVNIQLHVKAASVRWSQKQFAQRFDGHLTEMRNIQNTLNTHYTEDNETADKSAAKGDVVLLWLELFNESVGGDDTVIHGKDVEE